MLAARRGRRVLARCHDALMRPIDAEFAVLADGTAVVEMAAAAGLLRLARDELNALFATTYGVGELIAAALEQGAREIIVGVGGSATVDGGSGAMHALGARLLDGDGQELAPGGGSLKRLQSIDLSGVDARLLDARVPVASDVRNVLCGEAGAAIMFGPQKGASPEEARMLDEALANFAEVVRRDLGVDVRAMPGSGAAGGLGAGLAALCGATIESGFELVAEVTDLRAAIASCDVVITGEGRLDAQSTYGKTTFGVAGLAREAGKPVGVIAGAVDPGGGAGMFDAIESLTAPDVSVEAVMREPASFVRNAATAIARRLAGA
jgi:glycerate kinase